MDKQVDLCDIGFCQHLIEFIKEPCFMIFNAAGDKFILNKSFLKALKFSETDYQNLKIKNFYQLLTSGEDIKLQNSILNLASRRLSKNLEFHFKGKNRLFNFNIKLNRFSISIPQYVNVVLGILIPNKPASNFIDKSLLNMFNNDKFIDEVLVIMDFKGNILNSNRKLLVVNFFADMSSGNLNVFKFIDDSYKEILKRRIEKLKKGIIVPPYQYKLIGKNNKTAYIEIYSKCITYKHKKVILALIRDITVNKEIEKKLLYTIVQTEERERLRFASDLHDELGPFLSGLKLYINELQSEDINPDNKQLLFDYMHEMIDEAVNKVKSIANNMTPQNMIEEGLSASVRKFIDKVNNTGKFYVEFSTSGQDNNIEHSIVITIYRIILELLNNSIKHSDCKHIIVTVIYRSDAIRLIYTDDGKGFDLNKELTKNKGIGLKSIINRIELYQGIYKFRRNYPGGIEYDILVPLQ